MNQVQNLVELTSQQGKQNNYIKKLQRYINEYKMCQELGTPIAEIPAGQPIPDPFSLDSQKKIDELKQAGGRAVWMLWVKTAPRYWHPAWYNPKGI